MRFKIIIIIITLLAASTSAYAEKSVILSQKDAPLEIISYKAEFEAEYRGKYDSHPDQIRHDVKYKNISGKKIVAIRLGLGAFDAFNSFMNKLGGVAISDIEEGKEKEGAWAQRPYASFTFRKYGIGFVYVDVVRFEDGTIWRADLNEILEELRKFESSLEEKDLEEKKE